MNLEVMDMVDKFLRDSEPAQGSLREWLEVMSVSLDRVEDATSDYVGACTTLQQFIDVLYGIADVLDEAAYEAGVRTPYGRGQCSLRSWMTCVT